MTGMINEIAEQQLKKAGWYPGRKIDISDQIEFWESLGYQTFDAAVKFMEEFGKLHITDSYIDTFDNSLSENHHIHKKVNICNRKIIFKFPQKSGTKHTPSAQGSEK